MLSKHDFFSSNQTQEVDLKGKEKNLKSHKTNVSLFLYLCSENNTRVTDDAKTKKSGMGLSSLPLNSCVTLDKLLFETASPSS